MAAFSDHFLRSDDPKAVIAIFVVVTVEMLLRQLRRSLQMEKIGINTHCAF